MIVTTNKNNDLRKTIIDYTCAYAIIMFAVYFFVAILGKCFMTNADGVNYNLPILYYIREWYLDGLLNHNFKWYDVRLGLGNNVYENLIWTGITDPFYLLLLFSPRLANVVEINSVIIIIKLWISGICFIFATFDRIEKKNMGIVCALQYVFSGFLYQSISNCSYDSVLLTFPLIISGAEKVATGKKISKRLIIGVFYQLISAVFFGPAVLFWASLVFCVYLYEARNDFRENLRCCGRFIINILFGVGISSYSFCAQISGILKSPRNDKTTTLMVENVFGHFLDYLGKVFVPYSTFKTYLGLGLSITILWGILSFLFSERKRCGEKIIILLSFVFLYFKWYGFFLSGFGAPRNERFIFISIFFICYFSAVITSNEYLDFSRSKVITYNIIMCFECAYLVLNHFYIESIYVLFFGLIAFVLVKKNSSLFCAACLCSILISALFSIYHTADGLLDIEKWHNSIEDNDFIVDKDNTPFFEYNGDRYDLYLCNNDMENLGACYGNSEMSQYLSTPNSNLLRFFKAYGLFGASGNALRYQGLDEREILEDIFSVDIFTMNYGKDVVENKNKNKWMTVYSNAVSSDSFEKLSYIQRYNLLTQAAVLQSNNLNDDIDEIHLCDIENHYQECEFSLMNVFMPSNVEIEDGEKKKLTILDEISDEYEYYIQIDSLEYRGDDKYASLYVGDKCVELYSEKDLFIKIYPDKDRQIGLKVIGKDVNFQGLKIYKYDINDANSELIKTDYAKDVKVNNDRIKGNVDGKGKIVCIPLMYDNRFEARINGVEVPIILVNNGLMGVVTTEENNNISFSYNYDRRFMTYCAASIITIIIMTLYLLSYSFKGRASRNTCYGFDTTSQ